MKTLACVFALITIWKGTKCVQSGRTCVFPKIVRLNGAKLDIQ